jgi:hypothetical protein
MTTIMLAVLAALFVLGVLVLFPVVGLAMIPIVLLALIAVGAAAVLVARGDAEDLPERRAPGEDV